MMSMGGKSMQLGHESNLFSLPFAAHLGYEMLRSGSSLAEVARVYEARCVAAKASQGLGVLEGEVVGVTDVMIVADALGLGGRTHGQPELLQSLRKCVRKQTAAERAEGGLGKSKCELLCRVLVLEAVVQDFLAPSCTVSFRNDFQVSWTEGFFASR